MFQVGHGMPRAMVYRKTLFRVAGLEANASLNKVKPVDVIFLVHSLRADNPCNVEAAAAGYLDG